MTIKAPIQPGYTTGQTVSAASSAASVALTPGSKQLILTNLGSNLAYVRAGQTGSTLATAADYPVPAGAQVVISKGHGDNQFSYISPVGTTLHVMDGEGF